MKSANPAAPGAKPAPNVNSGFLPLERLGYIGVFADGEIDVNKTGFPIVYTFHTQVPVHLIPRRVSVRIELRPEGALPAQPDKELKRQELKP